MDHVEQSREPALPVQPPKSPVWPAFTVLAVTFAAMLGASIVPFVVVGIQFALSKRPFPTDVNAFLTPGVVISSMALTQLALLVCTRFLPRLLRDEGTQGFWRRVNLDWNRFSWVEAIGLSLLCLGCAQLFSMLLFDVLHLPVSDSLKALAEAFLKTSLPFFVVATLFVSLAPAWCEELLFRGYLQQRFVERWGGTTGPVLASVLFSAYHMDPVHVLATLPIGLLLGLGARKSGTILHGMVAHAANNFTASMLSRYEPTAYLIEHPWVSPVVCLTLALTGALIVTAKWRHCPAIRSLANVT